MALIGDFARAVAQLTDRRFLWVLAKALGLTVLLLVGFAAVVSWLVGLIPTNLGDWPWIGHVELPSLGLQALSFGAVAFGSSFLMIPVAAVFVSFFLEEIAEAVEARHYPDLAEARDIGLVEIVASAVRFLLVVIGVNLLALIPYLIIMIVSGPLVIVVAYAVNGYLLGREYFELVAARRLAPKKATALRRRHSGAIWFAGICMVVPLTIPIMNLLVPVLGVATITHQFHRLQGA